ncbi:hypothetical protein GSI_09948 [Ganoderma sinense ZZ0214-1]|uniref:non-specific serine/threonine protein kinase n=1 Tax=Ganoderma sinense ZZ0214-1 TaxID=1077348 RepID=A0A2G8S2A8_9APHY|nr:hypothetical protein GSI_09948 [Ganoderma sinense ZZ0214-1]
MIRAVDILETDPTIYGEPVGQPIPPALTKLLSKAPTETVSIDVLVRQGNLHPDLIDVCPGLNISGAFLTDFRASFSRVRILTRDASTPKAQCLAYKGAELFEDDEDDVHSSLDVAFADIDVIVNTLPTTISDDVNHSVLDRNTVHPQRASTSQLPGFEPAEWQRHQAPAREARPSFRGKVIALYTSLFFELAMAHPVLGFDIANNEFTAYGSPARRVSFTSVRDVGRAVERLAILSTVPHTLAVATADADGSMSADDVRIAGATVTFEEDLKEKRAMLGVPGVSFHEYIRHSECTVVVDDECQQWPMFAQEERLGPGPSIAEDTFNDAPLNFAAPITYPLSPHPPSSAISLRPRTGHSLLCTHYFPFPLSTAALANEDRLRESCFGRRRIRVYRARVVSDQWEGSRAIAMKKIRTSDYVEYPVLLHEACGLVLARGKSSSLFKRPTDCASSADLLAAAWLDHPSIPQVFGWGRSQFYEYLAVELLGCDLATMFQSRPLTRRNFVSVVLQMFAAVKHVHASGILHCDIKPENFMLGRGEHAGRVYLIDFNLWTAWRHFDTREHLDCDEEGCNAAVGFRGTYTYASINCHLDGALSRRDDLESLAYTIFALYAGGLPWSGRGTPSADILEMKQIWQKSGALQGSCAYPLGDLVYYAQSLGFTEEPDYDGWREAFWRVDNPTAEFPECDPLYDPADDATETETVPRNMDFADWKGPIGHTYTVHFLVRSNAGRMKYAPGSNHGYRPDSSRWNRRAMTMLPEDTMEGELDIIRDFVKHISAAPTTQWESLTEGCDPEEMRGFEDPIPFRVYDEEEPEEDEEELGGGYRESAGEETVEETEIAEETDGGEEEPERWDSNDEQREGGEQREQRASQNLNAA